MKILHLTRPHLPTRGRRALAPGLGLALVLLLLSSACASPNAAVGSPTPPPRVAVSPTPTTGQGQNTTLLTVLPLLQQSQQATAQLSAFHFAVQGKGTLQTGGQFLPALAQATPFTLAGSGEASATLHQEKGKGVLTLMLPGGEAQPLKWSERLIGAKLYVRGPGARWFILDLAALAQFLDVQGALPPVSPQALLPLSRQITVVDHGTTALMGMHVRHLTLSLSPAALAQIAGQRGQTRLSQLPGALHLESAQAVDLSIDEATERLVRVQLEGSVLVNVDELLAVIGQGTAAAGATPRTVSATYDLILTLSKFNQQFAPVVAPAGATPVAVGTLHPLI
jgi:hypothetical protein